MSKRDLIAVTALTATLADGVYSSGTAYGGGGASWTYENWTVRLGGLDATDPVTVSQGDTIDGTITFDEPFTFTQPNNPNWPTFINVAFSNADSGPSASTGA